MPVYEAQCPKCGHYESYLSTMEDRANTPVCPECGTWTEKVILSAPAVKPDVGDWRSENNGKGRYIGQLQRTIGKTDPNAYCTTRQEAMDKAKKMGHKVERTR